MRRGQTHEPDLTTSTPPGVAHDGGTTLLPVEPDVILDAVAAVGGAFWTALLATLLILAMYLSCLRDAAKRDNRRKDDRGPH